MTSPSLQNFKYLFKQLGSTETRYIKDLNKCKYSKYNKPCKPVFIFIRMFANWLTFFRTTYLLPSNCVLWTEPVQDKTLCLGSQQSLLFTCAYTRCLQPTFAVYQALGQDSVKAHCEYWRHWIVWETVHTDQLFRLSHSVFSIVWWGKTELTSYQCKDELLQKCRVSEIYYLITRCPKISDTVLNIDI